jgi:hypothetical protein
MEPRWITTICLGCIVLLPGQVALAQVCHATNSRLNGQYGFVASEAGTVAVTPTAIGTVSPITSPYSTSELGNLLGGIAAGTQFSLSGVLNFDGLGNIDATVAGTELVVGTYGVNSDCSISVSLKDAFGANTPPTHLAGVVLGSGSEIDLTAVSNIQSPSVSGPTTTSSVTAGSGLTVKLVPVLNRNGCSIASLNGLYGFVLNPIAIQASTAGTGTVAAQPSKVIGYLNFDSDGHVVPQAAWGNLSTSPTTYSTLAFTGTYAVNADCSGTMTISNSPSLPATSTSSTSAIMIDFVISPPTITASAGSTNPNGFSGPPDLNLSFTSSEVAGWGYAIPQ